VAWHFLSTRDPKGIATFKADFEAAKQRFDRIEKLYPAAKLGPLVRAARTSLADAGAGREPSVGGDTSAQFKTAQRSDEIGEVAAAVAKFRDNVIAQQEAANNFAREVEQREAVNRNMESAVEAFRATSTALLTKVADNAGLMRQTAEALTGIQRSKNTVSLSPCK
jgi:hypothetical protein